MKKKTLLFNLVLTGTIVCGTLLFLYLQGYSLSNMPTISFMGIMKFTIPSLGFYGICRWMEYIFLRG